MNAIDPEHWAEISDLLYTIRNATMIGDILIRLGQAHLLPTILEYLFEQSQKLVEFCVKDQT